MGFDPFTMMLGGSALNGIFGSLGSLFGSSSQSKAADKAMQFAQNQFMMSKQFQEEMLAKAKEILGQGRDSASNYLIGGRDVSNKYLQDSLIQSNLLTQGGMSLGLDQLSPYAALGGEGIEAFNANKNLLMNPLVMDQEALEKTPGYQFALNQGLRAQQQSATTRGLGLSGAQLKGASEFATGLADQTYGNQFQRELSNRNDLFSRISGMIGGGASAAGSMANMLFGGNESMANRTMGLGNTISGNNMATGGALAGNEMDTARAIAQIMFGTGANVGGNNMQLAGLGSNALMQQGNANAAGIMGMFNSLGGALGNMGNMSMMSSLFGGGNMFSTSGKLS